MTVWFWFLHLLRSWFADNPQLTDGGDDVGLTLDHESGLHRRGFITAVGAGSIVFLFRDHFGKLNDTPEVVLESEPEPLPLRAGGCLITVQPQRPFRVERLVIPAQHAYKWIIEDITVGHHSQFVGGEDFKGIPGSIFSSEAYGHSTIMDPCAPGMNISVRVRYVGNDPDGEVFVGALFGSSIDDGDRRRMQVIGLHSEYRIFA